MTGPRQAAQLVRLAIKAGLDAEVYSDGDYWVAVIGRPGFDIEVHFRRKDRRWQFAYSTNTNDSSSEYAQVRRLVKKGRK